MNTKTLRGAIAAAVAAAGLTLAAGAAGLDALTFPDTGTAWDNDLDGKTITTSLTLEAGAEMELYNGTVDGTVTVGAGAKLALTGDAIAVTTLTLADGAVAVVDNAAKARVGTIHAVAGVVGETATTYYTTWAAALAAAGQGADSKTIELRSSFDDAAMGAVTLALNERLVVDAQYVAGGYADAHVSVGTPAELAYVKTTEGSVATYVAKYDLSKAVVASIDPVVYSGRAYTPTPSVTLNGRTLAAGTDFAYAYAANTAVGEAATVTISAAGADYAYEKSATFTIAASTPENPLVVTVPVAELDTLAQQLADAGDDASVRIVLDDDYDGTIEIPANVTNAVVDLNGHDLTAPDVDDGEGGTKPGDAIVADNEGTGQSVTVTDSGSNGDGTGDKGTITGDIDTGRDTDLALDGVKVDGTVDADGDTTIRDSDVAKVDGDGDKTIEDSTVGTLDGGGDVTLEGDTTVDEIGDGAAEHLASGDEGREAVDDGSGKTILVELASETVDGVTTYIYYSQADVTNIARLKNPKLTDGKLKVKAGIR